MSAPFDLEPERTKSLHRTFTAGELELCIERHVVRQQIGESYNFLGGQGAALKNYADTGRF